ncbi:DUF485 domain-containing protein [Kitasatospora kifunensis]|uniref:Uncharacterized membrane protein (DUF485 family) n=1 Tax=Kitasatospora kifunensis TaxID=58351 RepID=A0A7W7R5A0_KITKI|nr:uncharacterized membrane protein (DUF485 family) [Kitasatospora kifunensis]
MAQHEVTGSTGRTPRQSQRFDWWSTPGASGPPGSAARPAARAVVARGAVPAQRPLQPVDPTPDSAAAEVYREVQQSEAFQEIRRNYRTFVFPATAVFLGWYLFYVTAQAAAPDLMRTPVVGPFSIAWLLGLLQFVSTFLITWLYARNARTKRDRAALGLRWETQDQLR